MESHEVLHAAMALAVDRAGLRSMQNHAHPLLWMQSWGGFAKKVRTQGWQTPSGQICVSLVRLFSMAFWSLSPLSVLEDSVSITGAPGLRPWAWGKAGDYIWALEIHEPIATSPNL